MPKTVLYRLRTVSYGLEAADGYRIATGIEFFAAGADGPGGPPRYAVPAGLEPVLRRLVAEAGGVCVDASPPGPLPRSGAAAVGRWIGADPESMSSGPGDGRKSVAPLVLPGGSRRPCLGPPDLGRAARLGPVDSDLLNLFGQERSRASHWKMEKYTPTGGLRPGVKDGREDFSRKSALAEDEGGNPERSPEEEDDTHG